MGLPADPRQRVRLAIRHLAEEPRPSGAKLLAGRGSERIWRLRIGDYRVLYEIQNAELVVLVIRIGHRREVYRGR
jgi:mRNA interferase RelE/StbE